MLLFLACAEPVDCSDAPTWDGWTHGFFVSYCASCHAASAPDRHGAPEGMTFDTEAEARALAEDVRRTVLEEESMPVAGGVFAEDLERLDRWLECAP